MIAELAEALGDPRRVSVTPSVLEQHSRDLTYHDARLPAAVVYPESAEEVAAVLRWAAARGVSVTPFGAGTSLEGHVIPGDGGVSLDLTRMDRVLEVAPEDLVAVAQAGVLRSALDAAAREHGLWFPVDPGADATLGGMAATNASGTTTVRYGGMRANVLALEVVLADGSVVRLGSRASKTSAGYDLRALFVGSEGTLGVITELTLRLHGVPETEVAVRAAFPTVEAASRCATALVASKAGVARVELLDAATVAAVNAYKETTYDVAPSLWIALEGTDAGIAGDLATVREVATWEGCSDVQVERAEEGRRRLWESRHHVLFALLERSPGRVHRATDVCVPISRLPEAITNARTLAESLSLDAAVIAHAGDGNYHVLFMLDPDDPHELERAERLSGELVRHALSCGGTCTGEHGIGLGKIDYLEQEHGDLLPLMRGVKRLLDPNGILNPGKVVRWSE